MMYTTPGGGVLMELTPTDRFAFYEANAPTTLNSSDNPLPRQPTLVFIHNGGTSSTIWRHQVDWFSTSHHVLALDLPGFGVAPYPDSAYSLDELTNDVAAFIRERTNNPIVLIGNCMGSNISAGIAASQQLDVVGLIMVNPLSEYTFQQGSLGFLHKFQQATPALARTVKKFSRKITPPKALVPVILRSQFGKRGISQGLHHDAELSACYSRPEQLPALVDVLEDMSSYGRLDTPMDIPQIPTGVIWGEKNRVLAPAAGGLINNWLTPDHMLTIQDTGHLPMLEAPREVNEFIETLLKSITSEMNDSPSATSSS